MQTENARSLMLQEVERLEQIAVGKRTSYNMADRQTASELREVEDAEDKARTARQDFGRMVPL